METLETKVSDLQAFYNAVRALEMTHTTRIELTNLAATLARNEWNAGFEAAKTIYNK